MQLSRRIEKHKQYIALVAGIVFLLYLVLIPPVYSYKSVTITGTDLPGLGLTKHTSFFAAVLTESELLTDVMTYHIINRNQQSVRLLPNLILYALAILIAGYGILIHIYRCITRQMDQNGSVLAFSKGGHAPPILV